MNTKKRYFRLWLGFLFLFISLYSNSLNAQQYTLRVNPCQVFSFGTINAEVGRTFNYDWSMHVLVQYNPWTFENKKMKNFTLMPGIRYWFDMAEWQGFYVGGNAIVSRYNIGGQLGIKNWHDGMGYGLGGSVGFSQPIQRRLNIEIELGVSAIYYSEDQYECVVCGDKISEDKGIRAVPSKMGINLVYLF